jgi:hypothetical protein
MDLETPERVNYAMHRRLMHGPQELSTSHRNVAFCQDTISAAFHNLPLHSLMSLELLTGMKRDYEVARALQ